MAKMKKKMAKGGVTGVAMKAVGRNMARAENQSKGTKVRGTGIAVKGTGASAKMG